MLLPLGVSLNYVLLDASLALTAFVVGFIGAYFSTSHRSSTGNPLQPAVPVIDPLDAERNVMAGPAIKGLDHERGVRRWCPQSIREWHFRSVRILG